MSQQTHRRRSPLRWATGPLAVISLLGATAQTQAQTLTLGSGQVASWTNGTLNGDVVFDGNGSSLTVGPAASIGGNVRLGSAGVTGTVLNFAGAADHQGSLGASNARLGEVNFNSAGSAQSVLLRSDVWALTTRLDNLSSNGTAASIQPLNGNGLVFGGTLALVNPNTSLAVGSTRNTVEGDFIASGGTLRFALAPVAAGSSVGSSSAAQFDVRDGAGSGRIDVGRLVVTGGEAMVLDLGGSLRNGASHDLIRSGAAAQGLYAQDESSGRVVDNSFVIDSAVTLSADGQHLVYTASRSDDQYILKSGTTGHFSNAAARALGRIAAQGMQAGDLATAIDRFDIDGYGYGDSQAHLQMQMQRLAPVANNSQLLGMLGTTDAALATLDERGLHVRGEIPGARNARGARLWARPFAQSMRQSGVDDYDGWRGRIGGLTLGADVASSADTWLGLIGSVARGDVDQRGTRDGDSSRIDLGLIGVQAGWTPGPWSLGASASVGRLDVDSTRSSAQDRIAQSSQRTRLADLRLDASYRIKLADGKTTLNPFLSLQFTRLKQPSYAESGAGDLGLQYDAVTHERQRTRLGLRYATEGRIAGRASFLTFSAAASHDAGLNSLDVGARFQGPTQSDLSSFVTPAASLARTGVQLSGAMTVALSSSASLQARYDLDQRRGALSQGVSLMALQKF